MATLYLSCSSHDPSSTHLAFLGHLILQLFPKDRGRFIGEAIDPGGQGTFVGQVSERDPGGWLHHPWEFPTWDGKTTRPKPGKATSKPSPPAKHDTVELLRGKFSPAQRP